MKNKRIFIGPHEIAGYYANLARGFREIGIDCDFITYSSHPSGYGNETKFPLLLRLARFFNKFRRNPNRPLVVRILIALPGEILTNIWGLFAIIKYDIFIFGFGYSLLPRGNWDLMILKWLGKTVVSNVMHGSDIRPPYIDGSYQSGDGSRQPEARDLLLLSMAKKRKAMAIDYYSSVVLAAPFNSAFLSSKRIVNGSMVGIPFFLESLHSPVAAAHDSEGKFLGRMRILHSPSHPAAKGTPLILKAIESLKVKGYTIEFIMLSGKSNLEVMREILQCDFVVDQVYSDTPLAGFATEAAWFGKPAVVGGYAFDYLNTFVPEGMWPPSKTCHPEKIEQAIEDLIVNRDERLRLGAEAQKFVQEKYNAAEVARRYLRLIEGDIPEDWWLDPNLVTYLEGAGQPVEQTKETVRQMVEQFGVESLQLSHRPDLERAFLEFADVKNPD